MKMSFLKLLISNFRAKYRVSFRNPHDSSEAWYVFLSPFNIVLGLLSFFFFSFVVVVATIVYTPMLDLIPGYPGSRSREILIDNVMRLDSLQRELVLWNKYRENIILIMDGKTPISISASSTVDSINTTTKDIVPTNDADAALRGSAQVKSEQQIKKENTAKVSLDMYPPVRGVVVKPFDVGAGDYGVVVSVAGLQEVLSTGEGVVIYDGWSPSDGNIIQIQHGGNMVSVYKNLARTLKSKGDVVKAGDVIGYVGFDNGVQPVAAELKFELWDNGKVVDPEKYMIF